MAADILLGLGVACFAVGIGQLVSPAAALMFVGAVAAWVAFTMSARGDRVG